ncbi:MAG TPA: adenosylhomocysteinase, partial [Thermofilaceae archaeon]|nr:adenosylhomocysteinase [Thermofilaceae archaeon]
NLAAAEGHPSEVMDMSFSNQALAVEYLLRRAGKLKPLVYKLPRRLDNMIAKLKLEALGVKLEVLTREQREYLRSWTLGT